MGRAFADITFTPSVKAAQTRYGTREGNRQFELVDDPRAELTPREAEFIAARDSFYMASVTEDNWPYVQHRGGPVGFVRVIDARTLGYVDFSGNRQYLSVGNLSANDRVHLFFMDYARQRRLKVWGRAMLVDREENPALIEALTVGEYKAKVERAVIIRVEAFDWNCSQHITPRFTLADIRAMQDIGGDR